MELHLFRPRSKELFKLNLGTLVQIAAKPQWNKTSLLWLSKTTGRQPHLCSAFSSLSDSFSTADEQNGHRLLAWLLQYSGFTRDCLNHFSQMTAESHAVYIKPVLKRRYYEAHRSFKISSLLKTVWQAQQSHRATLEVYYTVQQDSWSRVDDPRWLLKCSTTQFTEFSNISSYSMIP